MVTAHDPEASKPRSRRFQFTLRSLLVATALFSVAVSTLGVRVKQARDQREAMHTLGEVGALAFYDYLYDPTDTRPGLRPMVDEPPGPRWLRKLLGDDFFCGVDMVVFLPSSEATDNDLECLKALKNLKSLTIHGGEITDAGLAHLKGLTTLEAVSLTSIQISDDGLRHLKGLTNLRRLGIYDCQITNGGLVHLKGLDKLESLRLGGAQVTDAWLVELGTLTNLKTLHLLDTQVTPDGVKRLQQALRHARIHTR